MLQRVLQSRKRCEQTLGLESLDRSGRLLIFLDPESRKVGRKVGILPAPHVLH